MRTPLSPAPLVAPRLAALVAPRLALRLAPLVAVAMLAACAAPNAHEGHGAADAEGKGGMAGVEGKGGMRGMDGGMMAGDMAVATLTPTQGSTVGGIVVFHAMKDQVMVHARVTGLKPGTQHGFHLHENGNCASMDGSSAGGHFNPGGKPHGAPNAATEHHAGDMPALTADAQGVADAKFMLRGVSVGPGVADISARSVIVHAMPDDYTSQPAGNSGARQACGVIARSPHAR